jgi:hypothetical protein
MERRSMMRRYWRWGLLFVLLSGAAYAFAYLCAPQGQVFTGFLVNNDDGQLYLSFMREGARGAWLTTIRTTPEAHDPALLLPGYLLLGRVAAMLGLSHELVFHVTRLCAGLALLVVARWLAALCVAPGCPAEGAPSRSCPLPDAMCFSALFFVAFSSGLGWLLVVTGLADRAIIPVDIRVPETSTFLTAYSSPHFALGVAMQLLTFICYLYAGRRSWALIGGAICLLLLSITLVYNVIVVAATIGCYALFRSWQRRELWSPELWRALAIGGPSVPVILYYLVLFRTDPFWRIVYGEHDVVHTPAPLALALGYGIVLGLAAWGLLIWTRERRWSAPRLLLACWVVLNAVLLYAPLAFQGKLAAGWHVGLSLLAAVGLHRGLLARVRDRPPRLRGGGWAGRGASLASTVRNVILILSVPSTLLVALIGFRVALAEHYYPYYLPADDAMAVTWLGAHARSDDVVLASYSIGNYTAARSDARSFLGHQFAVIDPQGKDQAVRSFYSGRTADEERRALVASHGITLVYYGAHERRLGLETGGVPFEPEGVPWLVPVYRGGETAIYRIVNRGRHIVLDGALQARAVAGESV